MFYIDNANITDKLRVNLFNQLKNIENLDEMTPILNKIIKISIVYQDFYLEISASTNSGKNPVFYLTSKQNKKPYFCKNMDNVPKRFKYIKLKNKIYIETSL